MVTILLLLKKLAKFQINLIKNLTNELESNKSPLCKVYFNESSRLNSQQKN